MTPATGNRAAMNRRSKDKTDSGQGWSTSMARWWSGAKSGRYRYAKRKGRWDEFKLWQMGYKQEFRRIMSFFNNFGFGIGIMCAFTVVTSYSTQGLTYGGPVVVIWGWIAVGLLTLSIALSMAELLSAFPTSGGLYYWAWVLAPTNCRGILCWTTGFLNLMGQVAFTASTELLFAQTLCTLITMSTMGEDGSPGYAFSQTQITLIFAASILVHAVMNTISQEFTAVCLTFCGLWNTIGAVAFMTVLWAVAPTHNSHQFVWREYQPNNDVNGIESDVYIVLVGLLMSQWSMTGFDCVVNLSEETVDPDVAGSWAIPASVLAALVTGLGMLLSMTYSLQSLDNLFDLSTPTGGSAMAQVAWDVFAARYGNGRASVPLYYLPTIAIFMCGFLTLLSAARMVYAFSRDDAMMGSHFWRKMGKNQQPTAGTWLMALLTFMLGLPGCFNLIFYNTLSATSVVCLGISFGIPIAVKVWQGSEYFIPGPFRLGWASRPIGVIACSWILTSVVVFCLPGFYPLDPKTFNYTPAFLAFVLLFIFVTWWAPKFGAVHWFQGPKPNVNRSCSHDPGETPVAKHQGEDAFADARELMSTISELPKDGLAPSTPPRQRTATGPIVQDLITDADHWQLDGRSTGGGAGCGSSPHTPRDSVCSGDAAQMLGRPPRSDRTQRRSMLVVTMSPCHDMHHLVSEVVQEERRSAYMNPRVNAQLFGGRERSSNLGPRSGTMPTVPATRLRGQQGGNNLEFPPSSEFTMEHRPTRSEAGTQPAEDLSGSLVHIRSELPGNRLSPTALNTAYLLSHALRSEHTARSADRHPARRQSLHKNSVTNEPLEEAAAQVLTEVRPAVVGSILGRLLGSGIAPRIPKPGSALAAAGPAVHPGHSASDFMQSAIADATSSRVGSFREVVITSSDGTTGAASVGVHSPHSPSRRGMASESHVVPPALHVELEAREQGGFGGCLRVEKPEEPSRVPKG